MYNFGKNNRESNDLMFAVNSKVPTYFKVDIMHYLTGRLIKTQSEIGKKRRKKFYMTTC